MHASLLLALLLVATTGRAQTLNQANEGTKALTDKEQFEANNYRHSGLTDKVLAEECARLGQKYGTTQGCSDTSSKPGQVFKGTMGVVIEEVLPKLYSVMGTAAAAGSGGKITMKPKEAKAEPAPANPPANPQANPAPQSQQTAGQAQGQNGAQAQKEAKGEERTDLCIFIPMAGEIGAAAMQTMNESKIKEQSNQPGTDPQRDGILAVARTHDSRAKTATMQGGFYGATAGCYVAYLASGAQMNWSLGLKLGASSAMSMIFFRKAKNHKQYASDLREVAKKLPGAGDCNPHTQTQCFCAEPSSLTSDPTNYQKTCVPQQLAGRDPKLTPVPCTTLVNGNAAVDAECRCKRNNTCLNGQLSSLGAEIGFGGYDLADPLRLLNEMNGSMNDANVERFGSQLAARARDALKKEGISDVPDVSLNPKNANIAKELANLGMPARMAAYTANQANSGAPVDASAPSLAALSSYDEADAGDNKKKGVSYNYAGSVGAKKSGGGDLPAFQNPFAKQEKKPAVQVDTYAEQAVAAADINKDPSVGIFDIISHRYRRSAWSRFEMEKQLQETPAAPEAK